MANHKHDQADREIQTQTVGDEIVTTEVQKCSQCGRTMKRRIIGRRKK